MMEGLFRHTLPPSSIDEYKTKGDRLLADLRWSSNTLGSSLRYPLATEVEGYQVVVLAECALNVAEYVRNKRAQGRGISLPPGTVLVTFLNTLIFIMPGGVLARDVSLNAYCVVEKGQLYRLLTSAVVHVDFPHLLSNLANTVPACLDLEEAEGTVPFLLDVLSLTALSQGLFVALCWLRAKHFGDREAYYSLAGVGFSSTAYALKVLAESKQARQLLILGVPLPSKYSWVITVCVNQLVVPKAGIAGHLCGVVAGVLRAYIMDPALQALCALAQRPPPAPQLLRPRFNSSGRLDGRPLSGTPRWQAPWRHVKLRELGVQLGLVGAVGLAFGLLAKNSKTPRTTWR